MAEMHDVVMNAAAAAVDLHIGKYVHIIYMRPTPMRYIRRYNSSSTFLFFYFFRLQQQQYYTGVGKVPSTINRPVINYSMMRRQRNIPASNQTNRMFFRSYTSCSTSNIDCF